MDIKGFIDLIEGRTELGEICWNQRIRTHSATYSQLKPALPKALSSVLNEVYSIDKLYSHQAKAIKLVREGKNVVVMTPTASGSTTR